jgi:2-oxoglutarate ferredoxin oxidoreductase subunit alpha
MARKLMKGNEAIAEAAIACGCRSFFGYPITPQNEIPEYFAKRMPQVGGVFLQAESEIAAINMVYGAAGAGARVMTSSSSPGIALKQEGISYIAGAEIPAVVVNMVRGGPGLGGIQASQGDYFMTTKGGGHGDYRLVTYAPASIQEACDLVQKSFDIADKYRCLVMILGDGMVGQMMEPAEIKQVTPVKVEKPWATTGWDGKSRPRAVVNSLYIEPVELEILTNRLLDKYKVIEKEEVMYEEYNLEGAEYVLAAYGTVARIAKNAIDLAAEQGVKVGLVRPITLWPFPKEPLIKVARDSKVKEIIAVEMSSGQMVEDVRLAVNGEKPVSLLAKVGSIVPTPEEIVDFIMQRRGEK